MLRANDTTQSLGRTNKVYIKMLTLFLSVISMMVVFGYFYLRQPQFAQLSDDVSFDSPHFTEATDSGAFENQIATPVMTSSQDKSRIASIFQFLFAKDENAIPANPLPSVKTDLLHLNKAENLIVWMGHSSYFIQVDGLRFLIDPVFSENASPVPATNRAFKGSNIYSADDIPEIDYLLITHDHWDHLDYPTVMALQPKIKNVVAPLGVGTYFEQWGFDKSRIHQGDWNEVISGPNDLQIHILPARHFSGRLLTRNKTLWG